MAENFEVENIYFDDDAKEEETEVEGGAKVYVVKVVDGDEVVLAVLGEIAE